MAEILSDLTMLTNADSKTENITYIPVNLPLISRDVVTSLNVLAKQKNISLKYSGNGKNIEVKGDEAKLEKLILNMIRNSIKYTPKGGWIKLRMEKGNSEIRIIVEDNGIGIPEQDLPYIFERFYRGSDNGGREATQGSGLGLAIAKRILQLHETAINVTSAPGAGTSFEFDLPVAT